MRGLFRQQKKESTVDIVVNSFRNLLLAKKLLPGQKVPSESEISDGLGVSRGSVREAMKILSAFGIVEIKVGDGTYIPLEPKPAIIDPLLFSMLVHNPDIGEITQFRTLLEFDVIELVIVNKDRNREERRLLEANFRELERLRDRKAGVEAFCANDMDFHRIMGQASCNKLLQRIYDFALDYLEHTIKDTHLWQENGFRSYEVHRRLVDAIRANDLELAKRAVQYSIDIWRELQHTRAQGIVEEPL